MNDNEFANKLKDHLFQTDPRLKVGGMFADMFMSAMIASRGNVPKAEALEAILRGLGGLEDHLKGKLGKNASAGITEMCHRNVEALVDIAFEVMSFKDKYKEGVRVFKELNN